MKPTILIQLDTDDQPSVFDSVVAIDAGAQHLFPCAAITAENVTARVHGAIFTRGPKDLAQTAIFIGGSDVARAEAVLKSVRQAFFGPLRVSVMLDPNGANTTAVAAVRAAAAIMPLAGSRALVLAATGPVGSRVVRLLARAGVAVKVASRNRPRAQAACDAVRVLVSGAALEPCNPTTPAELQAALDGVQIVVAAGAAGVTLLPAEVWTRNQGLRAAIDLNAVPPLGIEGIEAQDRGLTRGQCVCYGALGVGAAKMKLHRAAISRLFTRNDLVLDAEELYALAEELG